MRISDWSSDVCPSDLRLPQPADLERRGAAARDEPRAAAQFRRAPALRIPIWRRRRGDRTDPALDRRPQARMANRKSVVSGKSVSVSVDLGGRRIMKKKNKYNKT